MKVSEKAKLIKLFSNLNEWMSKRLGNIFRPVKFVSFHHLFIYFMAPWLTSVTRGSRVVSSPFGARSNTSTSETMHNKYQPMINANLQVRKSKTVALGISFKILYVCNLYNKEKRGREWLIFYCIMSISVTQQKPLALEYIYKVWLWYKF